MALPPGPRAPDLIQSIQFRARPLAYLDTCAQRYGDIFTIRRNGASPSVYISSPSVIQEMLSADQALFEPFRQDGASQFLFGERSLIFREGEGHQRERRLLTPPLHGERLRANANTMASITCDVVAAWRSGKPFFVAPAMREITLRVIFRMLFDADERERLQRLRHLFSTLISSLNSPWRLALFRVSPRIHVPLRGARSPGALKEEIDRLVYEEIRERRARGRSTSADLLNLLISADSGADPPRTDQEVHDEVMMLLFAGYETTASALAWALYWLHHSPDAHDKLRRELDTRVDRGDALEISRLPYLAAVCQETLRLKPPCLSALRVLKVPLTLGRYQFAAGTTLIISIYLTHRRTDLYPRPERFEPERFLGRKFSLYEYLPFGGGNRVCLGRSFALFEMKLVLATILSCWQFARADDRAVKYGRRMLTAGPGENMRLIPLRDRALRGKAFPLSLMPTI